MRFNEVFPKLHLDPRFNEVFPKLHLDPEVAMYFENAEISYIKKSTTGLNIRIYLESNKNYSEKIYY